MLWVEFICWNSKHQLLTAQFSSVQSLSHVRLFVTPWTTARQASLSITNSRSLPKLMSIESVMPYNHLILCRPLLLLPSIFPNIRIFSTSAPYNVNLFGNRVVSDIICWGHTGTGWTPSPIWLGSFDKMGGTWTWTGTQGECHMKMKAEIGVMLL